MLYQMTKSGATIDQILYLKPISGLNQNLSNMDRVPIVFIQDLFKNLTVFKAVTEFARLPRNYGLCAKELEEKGHNKYLVLKNGSFDKVCFFDNKYNIIEADTQLFCPKFRTGKYVCFIDDNEDDLHENDCSTNHLDEFLKESGMLSLQIESSSFNSKWVETCSAWRSLQQVYVSIKLNESVLQLLNNLLNQEQLLCLRVPGDYDGVEEVELCSAFLQQKQFQGLRFSVWNEAAKNQLMLVASKNTDEFLGKTITWFCKATLHNDSFACVKCIQEGWISYRKGNVLVAYYSDTLNATAEEFMEDVVQCEILFV
ncbi:hypothetical protein L596_017493 [Steinernema carpocapsae]|uniref:Uncharacterized protein n=1 Tax=Steinernema carpocapsae TaxID=34508 RepID=A0A4U5N254_STECR|nr:hypothetical protein L596_017493 [Steinernema carpocapsae]